MELNEFSSLINENQYVVADTFASWCGPCKVVSPILESLEQEFPNVKFVFLDVDDNPEICAQYKIRNIPTVLLFKEGQVVNKIVGGNRRETYVEAIQNLING